MKIARFTTYLQGVDKAGSMILVKVDTSHDAKYFRKLLFGDVALDRRVSISLGPCPCIFYQHKANISG